MGAILDKLHIRDSEFDISFARSSGAGGQNVNKVNSKAILRWVPRDSQCSDLKVIDRFLSRYESRITAAGEVIITSERHRDQPRNVADCVVKLEEMLEAVLVAPKKRKKTKPSRGSKERRIEAKKSRGAHKQSRQKVRDY